MQTAQLNYYNDQELPSAVFDCSASGENFSTGWTFSVKLVRTTARSTTLLLKTTGFTSTATTVTCAWSTTDWAGLEAATTGTSYYAILYARRTADSKDLAPFSPAKPITLNLYAAAGTSAVSPNSYPVTVTAASVTFTPSGTIAATDVQAAIAEVETEVIARASGPRLLATNVIASSLPRQAPRDVATGSLTLGRQTFVLIWLPARTINTITFVSGTTGATAPTNQWFSLYDVNRNKLAITADDTTTAWAASTAKTLTISGGYTIAGEGYHYIGCMFAGTTAPQLLAAVMNQSVLATLPPVAIGRDDTNPGLTTPATAPAVAGALGALTLTPYCHVA